MQKRPLVSHIAAGALACAGALCALSAQAAELSYFAVVPVSGSGAVGQLRPVKMALAGATPPAATVGVPYSFNLGALLSLDGPEGTTPDKVVWSILFGKLPAGLELVGDRVSGVPAEVAVLDTVVIRAEYQSGYQNVGAMQGYAIEAKPAGIADFGGYRAWEDGTFAQSCEGYIRPTAAEHVYAGAAGDGVYRIAPAGVPTDVYCDQTTDGGGWTLLMKQAKGDGTTLQGDTTYWKNGTVLNDTAVGRNMNNGNFVSAAFSQLPVAGFRLQAANESTMRYQSNTGALTGLAAFSDAKRSNYIDTAGVWAPSAPNWFIHTNAYPLGPTLTSARFGFNFSEGGGFCAARWGWAGNENPEPQYAGSHDACGGLGGWGAVYGQGAMNNNKGAWQPATLYLWGR